MEQLPKPSRCARCSTRGATREFLDKAVCANCFAEELADLAIADREYFVGYVGILQGFLNGALDGIIEGMKARDAQEGKK
jgi:hypothetical protein